MGNGFDSGVFTCDVVGAIFVAQDAGFLTDVTQRLVTVFLVAIETNNAVFIFQRDSPVVIFLLRR